MITYTIESYWIPSQKKTESKLQILPKFQIFKQILFYFDDVINNAYVCYVYHNNIS